MGSIVAKDDQEASESPTESYGTRPIKRSRRSASEIRNLKQMLRLLISQLRPMTCRQVFYQAVTRGLIEKTEAAYKMICRLLADMRRSGMLPYDWIADNTRWMRKPDTHTGLASMLRYAQRTYRRSVWQDHDAYVEIWLEKEALAGVLVDVTDKWDVPLMVTRGYPSLSFVHSAAETIAEHNKPTYLYYFGDLDPSGVDIPRTVEKGIRTLAPDVDLTFERVAVNREQVTQYGLLTRPTKKSDSRSKSFVGESVEVDAIEPGELRSIASRCITQHLDNDVLTRMWAIEEAERETLRQFSEQLGS